MAALTTNLSSAGRRVRHAFSQRAQAAILSVALVLSAMFPAGVAVGQEQDQGQEGIAAPEQFPAPDTSAEPDFDPGGETTLPFDVGLPGEGGADDSGDGAPVDAEPVTDPDAPAIPLDDSDATAPGTLGGADEPAPPAEATPLPQPTPPTPPTVPQPTPLPPPATTPAPPVATDPPTATDRPTTPDHTKQAKRKRARAHRRPVVRVTIPARAPAAPAASRVATTAAAPAPAAPTIEPSARARSGQRAHTVQAGESLWTIANDLLATGATDGQVLAESKRLYRLNRDRIGANPNMLIAGTVLRLP